VVSTVQTSETSLTMVSSSLIVVGLAGTFALLVYGRQARQRALEAERRWREGQQNQVQLPQARLQGAQPPVPPLQQQQHQQAQPPNSRGFPLSWRRQLEQLGCCWRYRTLNVRNTTPNIQLISAFRCPSSRSMYSRENGDQRPSLERATVSKCTEAQLNLSASPGM
jgi:hypothetical protein